MTATTSDLSRTEELDDDPGLLTSLSVRELVQCLAACEEALWSGREGGLLGAEERRTLLGRQARLVRELRRRRLSQGNGAGDARRRSAAWPPPPW